MGSGMLRHVLRSLKSFVSLGPAPADPEGLIWPPYEPLVNGKLVTIEVVSVNGQQLPGRALENAIDTFRRYVAGEVRTVEGESVTLKPGPDGQLTRGQLRPLINRRRFRGPCDVTIYLIPSLAGSSRGELWDIGLPKSHVLVVNAKRCDRPPPMLYRERLWQVVITHELCHALKVPHDPSHAWRGNHCTRPERVLYPRVDLRSVVRSIPRLGPPMDLCHLCRREIHQVHTNAAGKLYDPAEPHDDFEWLNELVRLNPKDGWMRLSRSVLRMHRKDTDGAFDDFADAVRTAPNAVSRFTERNRSEPGCLATLAWMLATATDADLRDGPRAVELAERSCELTNWKHPSALDVLAAAYAETGQFDRAIEYVEKAIPLAKEAQLTSCRTHLKQYRSGNPWREPAGS